MILEPRLLRNRPDHMPPSPSMVPARFPGRPPQSVRVRDVRDLRERSGMPDLELPTLPGYPGTRRADLDGAPQPEGEPERQPISARGATDRGDVLIVSASRIGDAIERVLVRAGLATRRHAATAEALREMQPSTQAVVIAPPLEILQPETAVHVLEEPAREAHVPMLVVLDEQEAIFEERRADLIESGAERVYSWPRDGLRLAISLATTR